MRCFNFNELTSEYHIKIRGFKEASELAKKICSENEIYFTDNHSKKDERDYFEFISIKPKNLSEDNNGLIIGIEVYSKNARIVSLDSFQT